MRKTPMECDRSHLPHFTNILSLFSSLFSLWVGEPKNFPIPAKKFLTISLTYGNIITEAGNPEVLCYRNRKELKNDLALGVAPEFSHY